MSDLIKIAVDAMGGDNSPKKIIDGIIHNHNKNKDNFYLIFGDQAEIFSKLLIFLGILVKRDDTAADTVPSSVIAADDQ